MQLQMYNKEMIQSKQVKKLKHSSLKLTITIDSKDVQESYEKTLAKYQKSTQIKGFRKGKIPRDILERRFSSSILNDTLQYLIDSSMREALQDKEVLSPLPYAQPHLLDKTLAVKLGKPLTFNVQYDVYPEIHVGVYKKLSLTQMKVNITSKDLDDAVEQLQKQHAFITDKETSTIEKGDIVTASVVEVDTEPIENTRQDKYTLTVGEDNPYQFGDELLGMRINETRTVTKTLQDKQKELQVTIQKLQQRNLPTLDDEFAKDVNASFASLADLRADVRRQIEENADNYIRNRTIEQLMQQMIHKTPIELPASMIAADLEAMWKHLGRQYHLSPDRLDALLAEEGKTKEKVLAEWRPNAEIRLKKELLIQKMLELENITISKEKAIEHIREDAKKRNSNAEQIITYYKKNNMIPHLQHELAEKQLFDFLLQTAKITQKGVINYVDLLQQKE